MSFFFLLLFIFFVFWRPQEWLIPILYGWPILDVVVYTSVLALILEWDQGKIPIDLRRPQYFLLVNLFFAACLSHIANTYFDGLMTYWIAAFRLSFFGILLFSTMTSAGHLRWICRVFVLMACFMAVHAILQQTRGYGFGGLPPIMSWRPGISVMVPRSQFYGIFGDPNDLGQLFATAMPLSFVFFKRKSFLSLVFSGGVCYLLWQGIDACISRGSMLAVIVASGIIVIQMFPKRWVMPLLLVACVSGLGLLPFAAPFMEGSAIDRVTFWGEANWAFKEHPLFGVGWGMIREYISESRAVHNAFVTCYSEIGVYGYFFWFALLLLAVQGLVRSRVLLQGKPGAETQWLYRFSCWGLAALAGFAVSSYFLSRAFVFPLFFLLAMFGIVPFLAQEQLQDDGPPMVRLGKDALLIGIPASLLSVVYIYISILLLNATR